jgi:hypothetical protein
VKFIAGILIEISEIGVVDVSWQDRNSHGFDYIVLKM